MLSIKLDDEGDLILDKVTNPAMLDLVMTDGSAELAQRLGLAIRTRAGEWFLDSLLGIAWFEILGIKGAE